MQQIFIYGFKSIPGAPGGSGPTMAPNFAAGLLGPIVYISFILNAIGFILPQAGIILELSLNDGWDPWGPTMVSKREAHEAA